MPDDWKVMYDCFLCEQPFQYGPHVYLGRPVKPWGDMMVCRGCIRGNHDGIVAATHPHLVEYLTARKIAIKYNKAGWIEWPEGHGLMF